MSDLMRKEFEAWAKFHEIYGDDGERFPMCRLSGCYYENVQTQAAWEAWQASRKYMTIEIPEYLGSDPEGVDYAGSVFEIIHAAGVKLR